jgi:cell wall-associated NlpC family hydrolase
MRPTRFLLPLLALTLALALALLRPLPGRGENPAPSGSTSTTSEDTTAQAPLAVTGARRKRRLAGIRRSSRTLVFGTRVASYAKHLLGVPYHYGGTSPRTGFDCSGLVRYVYAHFGVSLAHSSFADFVRGRRVGRRQLRPGDLVFFDGAGHVGIYLGRSRFIHAPHTGTVVRISTMDGWYSSTYTGARRVR